MQVHIAGEFIIRLIFNWDSDFLYLSPHFTSGRAYIIQSNEVSISSLRPEIICFHAVRHSNLEF